MKRLSKPRTIAKLSDLLVVHCLDVFLALLFVKLVALLNRFLPFTVNYFLLFRGKLFLEFEMAHVNARVAETRVNGLGVAEGRLVFLGTSAFQGLSFGFVLIEIVEVVWVWDVGIWV